MARASLILVLLAGLAGLAPAARAAPAARQRVVLADPDPELRHAMEQALAPWHLEIVIEGPAPRSPAIAQDRADADTARFVVWREGAELVVYDRELGSSERRASRAGVLDAVAAAAAALTIKTMMRLPPPPAAEPSEPTARAAPVAAGLEVRLEARVAARLTSAGATARLGGSIALRPWSSSGWRFGVALDGGTATSVSRASFQGTWRDWAALGVVSWTSARAGWELEPHAGLGLRRSSLDGTEMNAPRSEATTLAVVRGGVALRRRVQRWTIGALVTVDASFGTPTYSKTQGAAEIFQVPAIGVELGAIFAADL